MKSDTNFNGGEQIVNIDADVALDSVYHQYRECNGNSHVLVLRQDDCGYYYLAYRMRDDSFDDDCVRAGEVFEVVEIEDGEMTEYKFRDEIRIGGEKYEINLTF